MKREPFELDVTEETPTEDQLRNIVDWVGTNKIGSVVEGATSISDAVKKLAADQNAFKRPVVVDWSQGRAGMFLQLSFYMICCDITAVVGVYC